jgi:hypothetical protein
MHQRATFIVLALAISSAGTALAQLAPRSPATPAPQPAPPPKPLDAKEVAEKLAKLEQIGKTLDEQKFGYNARIIKELREAGVSGEKALALWLDCKKDVDFDQAGKTMTEFAEWKRRMTKDPNRERDAELQLQVQWLAIVLMDANARSESARGEAITAALQFLDTLVERVRKADGRITGAARENVISSVFAKHYKLEATVSAKDGGAYVPGDIDAIYEKMILPFYRASNQAVNLMNAWKKRIVQQTAIADAFPYREAKEQFTAEKLPELQWGQARELFMLGQEESAAQTMLSIIQSNLAHRSASRWIMEFTALLKKEELPPTDDDKPEGKADPVATPAPDNGGAGESPRNGDRPPGERPPRGPGPRPRP